MNNKIHRKLSHDVVYRRLILIFIIVLFGTIDYLTGYEFSFYIFYLVPIAIATWYDERKVAFLSIVVCMLVWLAADLGGRHDYSHHILMFIWNVFVRFLIFYIMVILLLRIKANWKNMKEMAMSDSLTQLRNFRAFYQEYQVIKKLNFRSQTSCAIGIIDLDGFKNVNDTYGHMVGDEVLAEFANVLKEASRYTDVVARLGGDEFALILQDMTHEGAEAYDARLRKLFKATHLSERYQIDFSMGLAVFYTLPKHLEEATHTADQLMYRSKAFGKSHTTIQYIDNHNDQMTKRS